MADRVSCPAGRQKQRQLAARAPVDQGWGVSRVSVHVCLHANRSHCQNSSLVIHIVFSSGPENTEEYPQPLPLTLRAARVSHPSGLTGEHGPSPNRSRLCRTGPIPLLCVYLFPPHCAPMTLRGPSVRLVYTDVCLPHACRCRGGGSSNQMNSGKSVGKSAFVELTLPFEVIHL